MKKATTKVAVVIISLISLLSGGIIGILAGGGFLTLAEMNNLA